MAELFYRFFVALAIGALIGLERQFRKSDDSEQYLFGGVRTFPLIALAGCGAAMLADLMDTPWGFVVPAAIAGSLLVVTYIGTVTRGFFGMTTEVAALLTLVIGALCYLDQFELAAALGVATLGLLSLKLELHRFSRALTSEEIVSLAKFGLMTAIVLPVLPSEPILPPPFDVLSLSNIWLMVVLVAGIGFVGYALKKLLGQRKAVALTGFLGGLVSSTAVTLTFTERSKDRPYLSKAFAIAIIIAWTTMFIRVIVEVAVVKTDRAGRILSYRHVEEAPWGRSVKEAESKGGDLEWAIQVRKRPLLDVKPTNGDTALGDSTGWAWARNSPFRYYKQNQFEGGIATPAIVHWPAGLKTTPGAVMRTPAHR